MFGKVKDPVCGRKIKKKQAPAQESYFGTRYYFCSEGCYQKFRENRKKYVPERKFQQAERGGCCH